MSTNINLNDFQSICRTCMINSCNLKPIKNNLIIGVLQMIDINFIINDELPQQLCEKCIVKINEIHAFILQCKSTDLTLQKCLNESKITTNTFEPVFIKEEIIQEEEDGQTNKYVNVEQQKNPENTKQNDLKIHKCDICNKRYIKSGSLMKHIRIHIDKPFKCDICAKVFNDSSHLIQHKRIHNNERPYKCDVCHKSFNNSGNFIKHKRIHNEKRPFECDTCTKSFTQFSTLVRHKRIHTGERPYECKICLKTFKDSTTLKKHRIVHTGERPHQCKICLKFFSQTYSLTKHLNSHVTK